MHSQILVRILHVYRLASETSIFRPDLSAATRIHAKKGVVETSFVIAVICVWVATNVPPSKDYPLLMKDITAGWGRALPITANMQ